MLIMPVTDVIDIDNRGLDKRELALSDLWRADSWATHGLLPPDGAMAAGTHWTWRCFVRQSQWVAGQARMQGLNVCRLMHVSMC